MSIWSTICDAHDCTRWARRYWIEYSAFMRGTRRDPPRLPLFYRIAKRLSRWGFIRGDAGMTFAGRRWHWRFWQPAADSFRPSHIALFTNEKRPTPEGIGRTPGVAAPTVEESTHST